MLIRTESNPEGSGFAEIRGMLVVHVVLGVGVVLNRLEVLMYE